MNFNAFGATGDTVAERARKEREKRQHERELSERSAVIQRSWRRAAARRQFRGLAELELKQLLSSVCHDTAATKALRALSVPLTPEKAVTIPDATTVLRATTLMSIILSQLSHGTIDWTIASKSNPELSEIGAWLLDVCALVARAGMPFNALATSSQTFTATLWQSNMSRIAASTRQLFAELSQQNLISPLTTLLLFWLDATNSKNYPSPRGCGLICTALHSAQVFELAHTFAIRMKHKPEDMVVCATVRVVVRIAILLRKNQTVLNDFVANILSIPTLTALPREVFSALHNRTLWDALLGHLHDAQILPDPPKPWFLWRHAVQFGNVVEMGRNVVEACTEDLVQKRAMLDRWMAVTTKFLQTVTTWDAVRETAVAHPPLDNQISILLEPGTVTLALAALFPQEECHTYIPTTTATSKSQQGLRNRKEGTKVVSKAKAFFLELRNRSSRSTKAFNRTGFTSTHSEAVAAREKLFAAVNASFESPAWLSGATVYHTAVTKLSRTRVLNALACRPFLVSALWNFIENNMSLFDAYIVGAVHLSAAASACAEITIGLFCQCYTHFLPICNEHEFYTLQQPFSLDRVRFVCEFLSRLLFRSTFFNAQDYSHTVLSAARGCLYALVNKNNQHEFCPPAVFHVSDMKKELGFVFDNNAMAVPSPTLVRILREIPFALSFEDRVKVLRSNIANDRRTLNIDKIKFAVTIRRKYVVEDGLKEFGRIASGEFAKRNLKCRLHVQYVDQHGNPEAGIDAGGVFKEFLEELTKQTFGSNLGFFKTTARREIYPNPTVRALYDPIFCEEVFVFLGRVLGKAIYEGVVVDIPFAHFFLNSVLARPNDFDDLKALDEDLHRSLLQVRGMEDVSDACLYFCVTEDWLGTVRNIDLIPQGSEIAVTNDNFLQYLVAVTSYKLHKQFVDLVAAFRRGLYDVVNPHWFSMFSRSEFQQLISGSSGTFDIDDLRQNSKFVGTCGATHQTIKNLFEVLKEFDVADRERFLRFTTACSRAPLLGFAHMNPPFSIRCSEEKTPFFGDLDRLPSASTCFNLLKLPCYKKKSTLREKLLYAIRSNAGFDLS